MAPQQQQTELDYTLKIGGSPYGFGRNWSLVIEDKSTGETVKSFFLGQDAKVMSRLLGKTVDEYEKEYGTRKISELKEHIATDIIQALNRSNKEITQDVLQKLTDLKEWELAVE
jgi:hypothetical protein